ncbi:MAG: hypothetical protein V4653_06355 [Pseudomonadota bacterium]
MPTILAWLSGALMMAGVVLALAAAVAVFRAWVNGIPWWSGGMVWFNAGLQPPAARAHVRSAWRRFGLAALCSLAGTLIMAAIERSSTVP